MAHVLKYQCDFSNAVTSYTLEIYQKDYAGSVIPITGGASSVVHQWETDEPKPAIKGSSIAATLINESDNISLADLYSTDDEEFKAILVWHTGVTDINLFEGFIVQDDSSELMVDYSHEINISANDNLGLLKDIPFNKAPAGYALVSTDTVTYEIVLSGTVILLVPTAYGDTVKVGDKISIDSGPLYEVASLLEGSGLWNLYLVESPANVASTSGSFELFRVDLLTLISLLEVVKRCISGAGLALDTRVFTNINEVTESAGDCFLEQTFIDPQTFNDGSNWDDCYSVLEKIFTRFNCTLFQAKGYWNIIRWPELRDFDYSIPGFLYDSDFVFQNGIYLDENAGMFAGWPKFEIGIGETTQAETGLQQRITRPFKITKETFNYRQPENLLRNANLQELGNLITSYADGTNMVFEYEMPWWTIIAGSYTGTPLYYIRVVYDSVGNEIARLAVLENGSIESYPMPAAEGDRFTFSFSVITDNSQPGNLNFVFEIKDYDGTTTKYLQDNDTWAVTVGYTINIPSGDNSNVSHNFQISGTIPYDGELTVSLEDFTGGTGETQYRDITFEYFPMINQSTKIIGHTHTSDQKTLTKNKEEIEIHIDSSPRNSIAGTLFLSSTTGVLRDRCGQWNRATRTENKNLGEITTEENLFIRKEPRTLLEGTFYGLISPPEDAGGIDIVDHLSIITLIRYTFFPLHNFIFGRLEIDYSNNNASGTLFEMYKDAETDSDLTYYYIFQYLYSTK